MNSSLLPLAEFPRELIPMIAVIAVFMIPIVAIMAWHQQRMAMLVRGEGREQLPPLPNHNDISALRQDVQQLKDVVNSLAINVDNLNDRISRQGELVERMKVGE